MTKLNLFNDYHQLEDRITHGLIATLDTLRPESTRNLLDQLLELENGSRGMSGSNFVFDIQSPLAINQDKFSDAKQGVLLRITQPDAKVTSSDNSNQEGSRPDGWIFDGRLLCLIESKVGSSLRRAQLEHHKEQLKQYTDDTEIVEINLTWQEIFKRMDDFRRSGDLEDAERKVIDQFLELMYVEGITLNFEKLFNPQYEDEIRVNWESNYPKNTLDLLKSKIKANLDDHDDLRLEFTKEQTRQTHADYYWVRLFSSDRMTKTEGAEWRSTAYITPDSVSVDLILFKPGQSDRELFSTRFSDFRETFEDDDDLNLKRISLYLTNYGKRRNVQQGRDYRYARSEFNLGDHGTTYQASEELPIEDLSEYIDPKQIGLEYKIYNPRGSYWDRNQTADSINHEDARLLRNPDDVVEKCSNFLNRSLDVISETREK